MIALLKSKLDLIAQRDAAVQLAGRIYATYAAKCKELADAEQRAEASRIGEAEAMQTCHAQAEQIEQLSGKIGQLEGQLQERAANGRWLPKVRA